MTHSSEQKTELRQLLGRVVEGDATSLDELLRLQYDRLTLLTRRMARDFPGVKRWSDTGDILQEAMMRLFRALREVTPESPRQFLALASLQIRRELIDLARRYYGPLGIGANHDSQGHAEAQATVAADSADASYEPSALSQWTELHQHIDALPDDEKETVGLLFYQGLSQAAAADVLDVSVRTVQRRWHAALVKLHEVWEGGVQ